MGEYSFNGVGNEPNAKKMSSQMIGALPFGSLQNAKPQLDVLAERVVAAEFRTVKGDDNVRVITRVGGKTTSVSGLPTVADSTGANTAAGVLPNRSITPGTVLFTHGGAGSNVEDDGEGVLQDEGGGTARGTIDYESGEYSYEASGAKGETTVAYDHTDYISVSGGSQSENSTDGAGSPNFSDSTAYPIVPGTLVMDDQGTPSQTFVDDGKGNVIQTNAADAVVGTVNYGTGAISFTAAGNITTSTDITYDRDLYSKTIAAGGGHLTMQYVPDGGDFYQDAIKSPPVANQGGAYTPSVKLGFFAEAVAANGNNALRVNVTSKGEDTFQNPDLSKRNDALEDAAGTETSL